MATASPQITIIGAGIGGLSAALRLSSQGLRVRVLERHATPGGKMHTIASVAGPVDAGPTVLTMKPVFEALFADAGLRLEDHVTLTREHILARHFWSDGTTLDLTSDPTENDTNIARTFGSRSAKEFAKFNAKAKKLFDAFDAPMIQSAVPSLATLTKTVLRDPKLIAMMAPHHNLACSLKSAFSDPKLAQLFSRYATYVGGLPQLSPSLLSLIWHSEASGVWYVDGGMHALARAIETAARGAGTEFIYNADVARIEMQGGRVSAVHTADQKFPTDSIVFNGDPRALREGTLGPALTNAIDTKHTEPRSLSAHVLSFAAQVEGVDLAAHNVFFADHPRDEYKPLAQGMMQTDPTLYVCAQDRFGEKTPEGPERFEIILNAPPTNTSKNQEKTQCQTLITDRLGHFGLNFTPMPEPPTHTTPTDFATMFPASTGSLYGRSPHGMMAAFKRPTARTAVSGLYLVGGGAHPGAGVPMATLSARHAVEMIMQDLTLTSTSPKAAMRGGMLTGSATTAPAPSRS